MKIALELLNHPPPFLTLLHSLALSRIHPDVLTKLCEKMQANVSLDTLSLNYCKLDSTCGGILGGYLAISQIK